MDLMLALAAATKSFELGKAIMEADKHFSQAELKAKAAELMGNLADVKVALVEAREQIAEKDREIARLKSAFQLKEHTVRCGNHLYAGDAQGEPSGMPYCYRCEHMGVMIKLTFGKGPAMQCPLCKSEFVGAQVFSEPRD
jgi:hypothetical protein